MNFKKITLVASLMLSVSLLGACNILEEKTEKETPKQEVTEKPADKVTPSKEEVKDKAKEIPVGYKMGGSQSNGYILIPEDYANFMDVKVPNGTASQYAKGDMSIIVTVQTTDSSLDLEGATSILSGSLGEGVQVKEATVSGYKATEMYQYYPDEDYHLYVYLLDTEEGVRYMSIEFAGKDTGDREAIANSYSLAPYDEEPVSEPETVVEEEKEKSGVLIDKAGRLESTNKNLTVKQITSDEFEFEIRGNFDAGVEYIVSIYNDVQFDGLASKRFKAEKDPSGTHISGVLQINKDFVDAKYEVGLLHGKTFDVVTRDLFFTSKQ